MILTIWRHGEAGSAARDYDRRLTPGGCDDISRGVSTFAEICSKRGLPLPTHIAHSPWIRTTSTAELIAVGLQQAELVSVDELQPGSNKERVEAYLQEQWFSDEQVEHLLLVSHQPLVSRLVDHFLGEWGRVPGLSPGGLTSLELTTPSEGCGKLLFWSLPPAYQAGL
jgi:phosphohistidine phosphatase